MKNVHDQLRRSLQENQKREIKLNMRNSCQNLRSFHNTHEGCINYDLNRFSSVLHAFSDFLWDKGDDHKSVKMMEKMVDSDAFVACLTKLLVASDWYQRHAITKEYSNSLECKFENLLYELDDVTGEYIQLRDELERMKPIVTAIKQKKSKMTKTHTHTPQPKTEVCYVYIMRTNWNSQVVKIGISNHPKNREKTLRSEEDLSLWSTEEFKTRRAAKNMEKKLHEKYDYYRKRGEWFELPKDITDKGLKQMIKEAKQCKK